MKLTNVLLAALLFVSGMVAGFAIQSWHDQPTIKAAQQDQGRAEGREEECLTMQGVKK